MPLLQRQCKSCEHHFELLQVGKDEPYCCTRDEDWDGSCPACGAEDIRRIVASAGAGLHTRSFPYYDHALGMHIESYSHWKRVLKAKNLEPIGREGLDEVQRQASRDRDRAAAMRRAAEEEQAQLERNPEWQRAVASGYMDHVIAQSKEDMKKRMKR